MEFGPFLSEDEALIKKSSSSEEYDKIKELIALAGRRFRGETIQQAKVLGEFKKQGHACGVIITKILLILFPWLPKDSDLYVTQFDNSVVETAGLLKWISWV
jgi:DNA polymerase-3 subunit alpha